MTLSWIIQVDPKSSDKCPNKGHTEERQRDKEGRKRSDVATAQ